MQQQFLNAAARMRPKSKTKFSEGQGHLTGLGNGRDVIPLVTSDHRFNLGMKNCDVVFKLYQDVLYFDCDKEGVLSHAIEY